MGRAIRAGRLGTAIGQKPTDGFRSDLSRGERVIMTGLAVGNIVQYVTEDAFYAAIITKVLDTDTGRVHLTVFLSNGAIIPQTSRIYSEVGEPGTWHWLPAVD